MDLVKVSKIQMYFWFGMGPVTLVMVIILYSKDMVEPAYFSIPVICVALGFLRRWQFKKLTKSSAERDANAKKKKK
jgi:hypothetical protein